jgi:hypothetical protein
MKNYTRFSARASLAVVGLKMRQMKIWQSVERHVTIKQKVIKYTPPEKLRHAFINIVSGGQGTVEINTRVRPDHALQRAFGCQGCADQSVVSSTLNACTAQNVRQMRQANQELYRRYGQGYHHDYEQGWQVLDVDMTGMPAGRQGEGVTKGYFSGRRGRRGRQLGRVTATLYQEIVLDKLYSGKTQLERSLQELVTQAEQVLDLGPDKRQRTVIRVDAGGGRDADINWLLERHYHILIKVKNWQRVRKLHKRVKLWHTDPKEPKRQIGWVTAPHDYVRPTRQLAIRTLTKKGTWQLRVLVFTLDNTYLFQLARRPCGKEPSELEIMLAALYAYDLRGGGIETSIKDSKQGLGITKRNKRNFHAQEMLVLLTQLASNLLIWIRNRMAQHVPFWRKYGLLRLIRDAFHIPGSIQLDSQGCCLLITLNEAHGLASNYLEAISPLLARNELCVNLGQI